MNWPRRLLTGLPRGERKKLNEIQEEFGEEYYELTDEQKFQLMEGLAGDRDGEVRGTTLTSRGRLKILYSVMQNIEKEVCVTVQVCSCTAD